MKETVQYSKPQGLWFWNNLGRLEGVNTVAEQYGGLDADEILGMKYSELLQAGFYDKSVVPEILQSMGEKTIESVSYRTGINTINRGIPCFDSRNNFLYIVVHERNSFECNDCHSFLNLCSVFSKNENIVINSKNRCESKEDGIISESIRYKNVLDTCIKIARSGMSNVLLLGETGTGKSLLAQYIHKHSHRNEKEFVHVNCATLPVNLLEAELFGYEKGAFTGACSQGKVGLIELASGGTLFLDEIGDLPLSIQGKLLKFLDDHKIQRLGGTRTITTDSTVIAATNRDLRQLIQQGDFREDLFYRINDISLTIPPLRERPEDLQKLIVHFVEKYNRQFRCHFSLQPAIMAKLHEYPFPGNIRELESLIKRMVFLNDPCIPLYDQTADECVFTGLSLKEQMLSFEKKVIKNALEKCRTTREMANFLGINQSNVVRKLKKHNLS